MASSSRVADAARLSLAYTGLFLVAGAAMPYAPVFLKGRGLSPEAVGLAIGAGQVLRFIAAPAIGYAADAFGRPRLTLTLAAFALCAVYLLQVPAHDRLALISLTAIAGACSGPMTPVLEAMTMRAARAGGIAFGLVRSVGSAAFIVANVAAGLLIARFSSEAVIFWLIGSAAVCAIAMPLLPRPEPPATPPGQRWRIAFDALKQRPIWLAMAASAFIQGGHAFYYAFSAIAWRDQGLSDGAIGMLWAWGVAAEIAFLAGFGRRAERLGAAVLLAIGAGAGVVRWTAMAAAPDLPWLIAFQALHAATFAAAHLGLVAFIADRADPAAGSTLQSLNSALTLGGVLAAATVVSGRLYASVGPAGYLAMTVLCAVGLVLALALARLPTGSGAPHRTR